MPIQSHDFVRNPADQPLALALLVAESALAQRRSECRQYSCRFFGMFAQTFPDGCGETSVHVPPPNISKKTLMEFERFKSVHRRVFIQQELGALKTHRAETCIHLLALNRKFNMFKCVYKARFSKKREFKSTAIREKWQKIDLAVSIFAFQSKQLWEGWSKHIQYNPQCKI